MDIINGAGIFIYPLGLCSVLAVYMIAERLIALRNPKVIPEAVRERLLVGQMDKVAVDNGTVAGRVVGFYRENAPDSEALKAYARYEVTGLGRGLFVLDIVVGAAPLIGLLGTVVGLIQVFSQISPETGIPEPTAFVQGLSLALTTTVLGLVIALPAMVGNGYLNRRIELLAAQLEVLIERLLDLKRGE